MADRPILFSGPMVRALLDGRKTQTRRVLAGSPDRLMCRACGCSEREWKNDGCSCAKGDLQWTPCALPRFRVGDRLWVREGGWLIRHANWHDPVTRSDVWEPVGWRYAADNVIAGYNGHEPGSYIDDCAEDKRPSIHMPRWASRITDVVTEVRVQRLQDISEADAIAEGIDQWATVGVARTSGGLAWGEVPEGAPDDAIFWIADYDSALSDDADRAITLDPREAYRALWDSINGDGAWDANPWVCAISFRPILKNIDCLTGDE